MRALMIAAIAALMSAAPAAAQHNHAAGHASYQNWVNQNGGGCCNGQDCGALPDADERTVQGKLQVRIEGQWCPVLAWHYLKTGNAPDWTTAHVCVQRPIADYESGEPDTRSPCERLLCYQPKPQF